MVERDGHLVSFGRACHIRGLKRGSARYDPEYPVDMLNEYENLILLCANCHDQVDADSDRYTVDFLLRLKLEHEDDVEKRMDPDFIQNLSEQAGVTIRLIPNCLLSLSQAVSEAETSPAHLRPERPALIDFEKGTIVRRSLLIEKTLKGLNVDDGSGQLVSAIITGASGSGKTTLALHVGIELRLRKWFVLFTDVETTNLEGQDQQITDYLASMQDSTLLIIDNVQSNPEPVRLILQGLERIQSHEKPTLVRVLMTARVLDMAGNPVRSRIQTILKRSTEIAIGIDEGFVSELGASIGLTSDRMNDRFEIILAKCGDDLPALVTALEQLRDTGTVNWSGLSAYAVDRRLRNVDLTRKKTGETAFMLSAIFNRIFCSVSHRFIVEVLTEAKLVEPSLTVDQLVKEGQLFTGMAGQDLLISLGHPALASLLLEGAEQNVMIALKSAVPTTSFEELETRLWVRYCDLPPPDLSRFLLNLTTGLLYNFRYEPALPILESIERLNVSDPEVSVGLTNIGLLLEYSGRVLEAKRAFEFSLMLDDARAETWTDYGHLLSHTGDLAGSKKAHERACTLQPDVGIFHSHLGNTLTEMKLYEDAERSHLRAVQLEPDNPMVWTNLAALYADSGKLEDALKAFDTAIEKDDRSLDAWIGIAKINLRLQRKSQARKAIARAWKLGPQTYFDFLDLSALFSVIERYDLGADAARRALSMIPDSAEAFLGLAVNLEKTRQAAEIENIYQKTRFKSDDPSTWIGIGDVLWHLSSVDGATEAYKSAIEADGDCGEAFYRLALVHGDRKEYDEAESLFKMALSKGYENEKTVCDRADLLYKAHEYASAASVLESFLQEHDSAEAWFMLGRMRTMQRDDSSAGRAYLSALKLKVDYYQAWHNLGNCFFRRFIHGKRTQKDLLEKAKKSYRTALKYKPRYGKALMMLAQVSALEGNNKRALTLIRRAADVEPDNPSILDNLAEGLYLAGETDKAQEVMKRAHRLRKAIYEQVDEDLHREHP